MDLAPFTAWFSDLGPEAKGTLGFLALLIFLSVYSFRHWGRRRKALEEMMQRLGFCQIQDSENELVPELLLHPNGFGDLSPGQQPTKDLFRRTSLSWQGPVADRDVVVMDVSVSRLNRTGANQMARQKQVNLTAIRYDAGGGEGPPDLLIEERVLFKSKVRHPRSLDGVQQFGEHYYLFSAAPEAELGAWVTTKVRDALTAHRLWHIAVHDGIWYLSRGSSREEPHQMESFLREGAHLLSAISNH